VSTRPPDHKEHLVANQNVPDPAPRRREWQPLVNQEIALRIREARGREGLTRVALATRMRRGIAAVAGWENGHGVGLAALVQLAQHLPGFEEEVVAVFRHYVADSLK
jgi:hypothetical protein